VEFFKLLRRVRGRGFYYLFQKQLHRRITFFITNACFRNNGCIRAGELAGEGIEYNILFPDSGHDDAYKNRVDTFNANNQAA
jgi:hypothetical protein